MSITMWYLFLCLVTIISIAWSFFGDQQRKSDDAQKLKMIAAQSAKVAKETGGSRKSNKKRRNKKGNKHQTSANTSSSRPVQVIPHPSLPDMNHHPNLARILRRLFESDELGGVILHNPTTQQSHAIECYGPYGRNGITFEFIASPDLDRAKIFLRGETYTVIHCDNAVFEEFTLTLRRCCRPKGGLVDVGSWCPIFEGNIDY